MLSIIWSMIHHWFEPNRAWFYAYIMYNRAKTGARSM